MEVQMRNVETPADLDELRQLTRSILGELCWMAHLSYGDELILDIGKKTHSPLRPFANETYGAWWLQSRGTTWSILTKDKIVIGTSDDSIETVRQTITTLENTTVIEFEPQYPSLGLVVGFSNGNLLVIDPDEEDRSYGDVPYWQLSTPNHIIRVGSGQRWLYETLAK